MKNTEIVIDLNNLDLIIGGQVIFWKSSRILKDSNKFTTSKLISYSNTEKDNSIVIRSSNHRGNNTENMQFAQKIKYLIEKNKDLNKYREKSEKHNIHIEENVAKVNEGHNVIKYEK